MTFIDFCVKYKWWLSIGGFLTLGVGIGVIALPLGIIGFVKSSKPENTSNSSNKSEENVKVGAFDVGTRMRMSKIIMSWKGICPKCGGTLGVSKCKGCNANVQDLAAKSAKKEQKAVAEIDIPNAVLKKSVRFQGGHKEVHDPIEGWIGILKNKVIFKNGIGNKFEILFNQIKDIKIVSDNYTPSLGRGLVQGVLGGDTDSQSFRPHKSVLQITYNTGKRDKELKFDFNAMTWAGAVSECQKFYGKLNALLD